MILLYLGCKLASKDLSEAANRIVTLCSILTEGYKFKRCHLEFIVQFVKQKHEKILILKDEIRQLQEKYHNNQSSNKVQFLDQIVKEKEAKLKNAISFALHAINSISCSRKTLLNPQTQPSSFIQNGSASGQRKYFYYNGSQSGLEFSQSHLSNRQSQSK